ncbi:MAG: phosphoenolpyruvate synthase [Patescibacteria group bacterium]
MKFKFVKFFNEITKKHQPLVGGKNAMLGDMYNKLKSAGIPVPDGFVFTAKGYQEFLKFNKLENKIKKTLRGLDVENAQDLETRGKAVRELIEGGNFSEKIKEEIKVAYQKLSKHYQQTATDVAVRSSATAEDLPTASFAGQLESYLNVRGIENLLWTIKKCMASLYTDRAISYRKDKGFPMAGISISVGIQKMVRSDKAASGVMFTLETESGFRNLVTINAGLGLGENVVKGRIDPDEYYIFKSTLEKGFRPIIKKKLGLKQLKLVYKGDRTVNLRTPANEKNQLALSDAEILKLARWGMIIEKQYKMPMDMEWAKDGIQNKLYIVQARPETVHSAENRNVLYQYRLKAIPAKQLLYGIAIGNNIGQGPVKVIENVSQLKKLKQGDVLVTKMTDPAWEPAMKIASAIVTDSGGRTCHAAIVARELGIPALVGTKNSTKVLNTGRKVTVDCSQGVEGFVYQGLLPYKKIKVSLEKTKMPRTQVMMNVGNPDIVFASSFIPNQGVGLAREEFIISDYIKIHPLALINFGKLEPDLKNKIEKLTPHYSNKKQFYVDKLAEGIGQIAAAFYPKEVIVRFSDFKTNEYRSLVGGERYEPHEANPMLGWRGAARYYDPKFKPAFILECRAIKKVIKEFGLNNIKVMVPFCRTAGEGRKVLQIIKEQGLKKLRVEVYVMVEIPSNVLEAAEFAKIFDGFSIGSNDLTQLILGVDRDSEFVQHVYNEKDPAVLKMIGEVIKVAKSKKKKIGICGQAPSDFPDFARWLVKNKIDSMSLNPDSVTKTIERLK